MLFYGPADLWCKKIKEYFDEFDDVALEISEADFENVAGKTFYDDWIEPVIFIDWSLDLQEAIQHVAHEATHAVNFLFEYLWEESAKEIFAILVDEIVKRFMDLYVSHID